MHPSEICQLKDQVEITSLPIDNIQRELVNHLSKFVPKSPHIILPPSFVSHDLGHPSDDIEVIIHSMEHNTRVGLLLLNQNL